MSLARWLRRSLVALAALVVTALAIVLPGASLGLFAGTPPADLGFRAGAFAPGDWRPNWVSSTAAPDDATHRIEPLAVHGAPEAAWRALEAALAAQPRSRVVTRREGYLHVEFASAVLGFVDDVQFAMPAASNVIHVKSGARLGVRDFGVNRERVERIRALLANPR